MNFPAIHFQTLLNSNNNTESLTDHVTKALNCGKKLIKNIVRSDESLLVELTFNNGGGSGGTVVSMSGIKPNFGFMKESDILSKYHCIVVTTKGNKDCNYDFVSRMFAPMIGLNEDPVTGSAHCALAVYWNDKLANNKNKGYLRAFQASKRGGELVVKFDKKEDRVLLNGDAVTTMKCEVNKLSLKDFVTSKL